MLYCAFVRRYDAVYLITVHVHVQYDIKYENNA